MQIAIGVATVIVLVVFFAKMAFQNNRLSTAMAHARSTGEVYRLVEAVEEAPADKQPTHWDHVIGDLWNDYARELAAQVVVEAAQRSDATILQYWIRQVLEVEPKIAEEYFSEQFLEEHFDPEVASRCGKSGCCG